MSMTFQEVQELVKLISKSNLTEFKMKDGDFRLSVRTKHHAKGKVQMVAKTQPQILPVSTPVASPFAAPQMAQMQQPAPAPQATPAAPAAEKAAPAAKDDDANLVAIKSPMVGTFYRSPSPDKPAFVKVGDNVTPKSPVCIVEAMKLFNEIESEVTGKIVKV